MVLTVTVKSLTPAGTGDGARPGRGHAVAEARRRVVAAASRASPPNNAVKSLLRSEGSVITGCRRR